MHEGNRPAFPPTARDAMLLGGSVFGLLEREQGRRACVELATHLHPKGATAALEHAFGAHRFEIEATWWRYLTEMATRAPTGRASSR